MMDSPEKNSDRGLEAQILTPWRHPAAAGAANLAVEWLADDVVVLMLPRLTPRQQQILFLLRRRLGVRAVARALGITHPAVIKHRKKIARIAREVLEQQAAGGVRATA